MSETARKWKLSERSVRKYCDKVQQDFELLEAYDMNLLTGDFNKFKREEGDVHKRPLLHRLRWLPQENVQQLPVQFLVWLIPHRQIQPGFFVHNALVVGEGIKAVFPVVSSHTALAKASESHLAGGQVDDGIVDTAAAELAPGGHLPGNGLVGGEEVEGQRVGHGIDLLHGLIQRIIGEDGHERSEDLFLHHRVREGHVVHDGRLDLQRIRIGAAPQHHLVRIDQSADPLEMLLIDDLAVIRVGERLFGILDPDLAPDLFHQTVFNRGVTVDVIRRHAGLPAVKVLAEYDPPGGKLQVGGLLHNAGALSAQLQGDGSKAGGSAPHDLPAHCLAAGEENIIEMFIEKTGVLCPSSGDHRHILLRETFP